MARLSMNETTTFRWTLEEDAANYAAAGITAMGVWRQKLADCGQAIAIEVLHQHEVDVSHLFWAGGFTGSEGHTFRESVDDAAEALHLASALGAGCLVVYTGARAGHTLNHARRLMVLAMRELAPLADELGVCMALEPMHQGCAAEWTFLTTMDETLDLLTAIGRPQVKMVLDTYHLGHDCKLIGRIDEILPHVALVQLGDARRPPQGEQCRCRLGDGVVPIREIVAALCQAGYDGYYDVELLGEEFDASDYHSLLEHAQSAFRDMVACPGV